MQQREYPGWGAPKIREKLRRHFTGPHLQPQPSYRKIRDVSLTDPIAPSKER
jgi:hypothetical protein